MGLLKLRDQLYTFDTPEQKTWGASFFRSKQILAQDKRFILGLIMMNIKASLFLAVLVSFLSGCGGSSDTPASGPGGSNTSGNVGPIANAGDPQSVV